MAKDGLLYCMPPSTKYRPPIFVTGKKVCAADVARAASQTEHVKDILQLKLQMQTALSIIPEYFDGCSSSLQTTVLDTLASR